MLLRQIFFAVIAFLNYACAQRSGRFGGGRHDVFDGGSLENRGGVGGGAGGVSGFGGGLGNAGARGEHGRVVGVAYGGGAGGGYGGVHDGGQNYPPRPYQFDYRVSDEFGNEHYRSEESDQSGTVRGTYGYTDNQGLYRVVEYVADAGGFRANIKTNEPGTDGKQNPAGVDMIAEEPPTWIRDRYTRVDGGGQGGFAGGSGASQKALCAVDKKLCR